MENKLSNVLFDKYYLDEIDWVTETGFGKPILLSDNGQLAQRLNSKGVTINENRLPGFIMLVNYNLKIRTFNAKTRKELNERFNVPLESQSDSDSISFLFLTNENDLDADREYFKQALDEMENILSK